MAGLACAGEAHAGGGHPKDGPAYKEFLAYDSRKFKGTTKQKQAYEAKIKKALFKEITSEYPGPPGGKKILGVNLPSTQDSSWKLLKNDLASPITAQKYIEGGGNTFEDPRRAPNFDEELGRKFANKAKPLLTKKKYGHYYSDYGPYKSRD